MFHGREVEIPLASVVLKVKRHRYNYGAFRSTAGLKKNGGGRCRRNYYTLNVFTVCVLRQVLNSSSEPTCFVLSGLSPQLGLCPWKLRGAWKWAPRRARWGSADGRTSSWSPQRERWAVLISTLFICHCISEQLQISSSASCPTPGRRCWIRIQTVTGCSSHPCVVSAAKIVCFVLQIKAIEWRDRVPLHRLISCTSPVTSHLPRTPEWYQSRTPLLMSFEPLPAFANRSF